MTFSGFILLAAGAFMVAYVLGFVPVKIFTGLDTAGGIAIGVAGAVAAIVGLVLIVAGWE